MKKVIVEIHYMPDEQGKEIKIIIDGMEMDDVDYLSKIPFGEEWFQPSDGRWGWQGLVEEIRDRIEDREAELTFAFYGRPEYEDEFGQCLKKRGINQGERSKTEIVEKNLDDAKRNEHLGRYKEAFECYKIAAELGEQPDVQNIVGEYYKEKYEILNMEKSRAMSLSYDYFEKAAEQGDMKAQYHLFELFSEGEGVGKNIEEAVKWLRKSAALGNEEAQFQLGRCYAYGNGTEQNHNLAVFWYRKAAVEKNYAPAQRNLGMCYYNGEGVGKDDKQAVDWFRKAAEQGDAPAQNSLGVCYCNGKGVGKDYKQATGWYRKAAEQGNVRAQHNLGMCYENGMGVGKDCKQAADWYRKAAEQGDARAQYELGMCYENGMGIGKDYKQAAGWYRKAAEQGDARAQYELGVCYENGMGIGKDYKQAAGWYRKAAEQGDMKAQHQLFELFSEGKNMEEAVKWLKERAELGNEEAQFQLGRCYAYGNGIEQNHELAVFWYRKAAVEKNYAPAQRNLGLKYERGEGVEKNVKTAFQWYKCAADNPIPHSGACYQIAESYYEQINPNSLLKNTALVGAAVLIPIANVFTLPGAFVGSKIQKSMAYKKFLKTDAGKDMLKYYRKAAELGHEEAKKKLEKLNKYL